MIDEFIDVHDLTKEELVKFSKLKELSENKLIALYGDKLHDSIHAFENMQHYRDVAEKTCAKENVDKLKDQLNDATKLNEYWSGKIREFLLHLGVDIKCNDCKSILSMRVVLERNENE